MRMRSFDNGSLHSVTVLADEVYLFAMRWPCSGFRYGDTVRFLFELNDGILVDLELRRNGHRVSDQRIDGSALIALSKDALRYAEMKGGT